MLDGFGQSWLKALCAEHLSVSERAGAVLDHALLCAASTASMLAEDLRLSRWRRRSSQVLTPIAACYAACFIADFAERYGERELTAAEVQQQIEPALRSRHDQAPKLLEPCDDAARLVRLGGILHDFCARSGARGLGDPLEFSVKVAAAMAGGRHAVARMAEVGICPPLPPAAAQPPPAREAAGTEATEASDDWTRLPALALTGAALGFSGRDQRLVDLCVGFGVKLSGHLRNEHGVPLPEDSEPSSVVIVAGFLAAAPLVSSFDGTDVFAEPVRRDRIRAVAHRVGLDFDALWDVMQLDPQRFVDRLARAVDHALASLGVQLGADVVEDLPRLFMTSAKLLQSSETRTGS